MARGAATGTRAGWLPHPLLSLFLVAVWLLLVNDFSVGGLLFGLALGIATPLATRRFWPAPPRVRIGGRMLEYALVVLWDIAVANVQVARLILFRPPGRLRSRWIVVPLELRSLEAITVLAGTITMTPGTVSCDLSADRRSLLVHCLDAPDAAGVVRQIKTRYESRLMEIFP